MAPLKLFRIFMATSFLILITSGLNAQKRNNLQGIETGMTAPEIDLPTVSGDTMKLSDLRGKVVLLNFWASWCAPCRKKAPALIELHDKYQNEAFENGETGFEIVSVSLDKNHTAWENSIQKDQTGVLLNVGDMKGWDGEAAKRYSIKQIPTTVLINGEGEIIALNLSTKELNKKLKQLKKRRWFW